jgi:CheY-like chemotaxis protein
MARFLLGLQLRPAADGRGAVAVSQPTILLVEDDVAAAEALRYLLEIRGYAVVTARQGREAVACLEEGRPDLVLSDVMMPIMDGLELAAEIRRRPELSGMPVVLMSAAHEVLHRAGPLADVLLPKPLDFPRLLSALDELLDRPITG